MPDEQDGTGDGQGDAVNRKILRIRGPLCAKHLHGLIAEAEQTRDRYRQPPGEESAQMPKSTPPSQPSNGAEYGGDM